MTVAELVMIYMIYARQRYGRSRHVANLELGLRPLRDCHMRACEYGPADLRLYRDALIARGLKRRTINQWVSWVRGMFRWSLAEGHPFRAAYLACCSLDALRAGATVAPESVRRSGVTPGIAARVFPFLPASVVRMVAVQWLAAMRPSEVVAMRWSLIREHGGHLVYTPEHHKCERFGLFRDIWIAPGAVPYLGSPGQCDIIFPSRRGTMYTTDSYNQAIRRACHAAGVPQWSAGLLRHGAATECVRKHNIEAARRLLGHQDSRTTARYVSLNADDVVALGKTLVEKGWEFSAQAA